MALISSQSLKKEVAMSDKVAKKDITILNDAGQTVVVVPKGQPVPEDLDAAKRRAGAIQRSASDDEIAAARGEDKAKRSSRGK